jgi:hypothetical protein
MALPVLLAGAAACSGEPTKPRRTVQAWTVPITPVGQSQNIGGVAVLLATEGRRLTIQAFDSVSGRQLWKDQATPSAVLPGIAVSFSMVRDAKGRELVGYYSPELDTSTRPDGNVSLLAHLKVVEAETGTRVAEFGPLYFRTPVDGCTDDAADGKGSDQDSAERDVCVKAQDTPTSTATYRRFDIDRHTSTPDTARPHLPKGARELGFDVYDLGSRNPETLTRLSKTGRTLWSVPLPSAFPPGTTSDHGWSVEQDSQHHVDLVTLGGPETKGTIDLSRWDPLAGIDDASGKVLWHSTGASLNCNERLTDSDQGRTVPLRCRYTGSASYQPRETLTAKDVIVEGFDTTTGATRWSVDAGPYRGLFPTSLAGPVLHLAEHRVLLDTASAGPIVLNLLTGKTTPATPGVVATCTKTAHFEYGQPYYINNKPIYDHTAGELVRFCTAADHSTTSLPAWDVLRAGGTTFQETTLIASTDSLTAYRRS